MPSKNYWKVKEWFDLQVWNEDRLRNAVVKGWITKKEFKEITGKDY